MLHADEFRSCYARTAADLPLCPIFNKCSDERSSFLLAAWRTGEPNPKDLCLAKHSHTACEVLRWRLVKSICAPVFLEADPGFHTGGCDLSKMVGGDWSDDIPSGASATRFP